MKRSLCVVSLLAVLLSCGSARAAEEQENKPTQEELEKKFEASMTNVVFAGSYTVGKSEPKNDRYTIKSVKKAAGETWLFTTRIQYGDHDLTVPLPLTVKWAGDTPVITLDTLPVPGLGTFSARVVIHDGKYAGTWDGGDHGGHLWGMIEKAKAEKKEGQPEKK